MGCAQQTPGHFDATGPHPRLRATKETQHTVSERPTGHRDRLHTSGLGTPESELVSLQVFLTQHLPTCTGIL